MLPGVACSRLVDSQRGHRQGRSNRRRPRLEGVRSHADGPLRGSVGARRKVPAIGRLDDRLSVQPSPVTTMTMSKTGRKWTRLLLPLAGMLFAVGEGAWHTLRSANADLADLAAETELVRSQRAKLEA